MALARTGLAVAIAPLAAAAALAVAGTGAGIFSTTGTAAMASTCPASPAEPGTPTGVGRETLDATQIANAQIIYSTGIQLGVPASGEIIAVATAMQESRLRNLSYGDRDSLGLFQQRHAWGPASQRTAPAAAAAMFFTGGAGGQPGLTDIHGWQDLPLTQAAQAVQRSATPGAYARWEPIATQLVATFTAAGQPCTTDDGIAIPGDVTAALPVGYTLPDGTPRPVSTAISWAAAQLGTPYHYGGDCTAARSGNPTRQCDCSSLVQQAYRAAGVTLPRTTSEQINEGTPIYSIGDLLPGDLIFLPGHVGLYLGDGLVLHAPKTGDHVKISQFQGYWPTHLNAMRRIITR